MAVEDNEWSKKQKSVNSRNPGHISINQTILKIRGEVETYLIDLKRNNLPYVHADLKNHIKSLFQIKPVENQEKDLFYAFDLFIQKKSPNYSPRTITAYRNTLNHLNKFSTDKILHFECLNKDWFERFTQYLRTELNHSPSMRGKQVKTIKSVMNFAFEEGLHNESRYRSVKKESENSPNIYLSEEEIDRLYNTPFATQAEQTLAKTFVFICLTGLRYSDYYNLTKRHFTQKGKYLYIQYQQHKTKQMVSVPILYKRACEILINFDFELPKYSNAYLNRGLKKLFKKYRLFEEKVLIHKEQMNGLFTKNTLVSVHTGRRSFATNQFLKNIPINLIMAATGHESVQAFRLYIKADEIEKARNLINYTDY